MGEPRRLRKKYSGPRHPWQLSRLQEEKKLVHEFGLKTKSELWKFETKLKNFTNQAKRLISLETEQAKLETKQLLDRLSRLGILKTNALSDVLGLSVKEVLGRRLQTLVFKRGLARTSKQARQFITHGHIHIDGKIISAPSYLVPEAEEAQIGFVEKSALSKEDHPERGAVQPKRKETPAEEEKKPAEKAASEPKKTKATSEAKQTKGAKA